MGYLVGVAATDGPIDDHADASNFFLASSTNADFSRFWYWSSYVGPILGSFAAGPKLRWNWLM